MMMMMFLKFVSTSGELTDGRCKNREREREKEKSNKKLRERNIRTWRGKESSFTLKKIFNTQKVIFTFNRQRNQRILQG